MRNLFNEIKDGLESITQKIDSVTHIPECYLRPDPPPPKAVKIEITGRCNYRCAFCALRSRPVQPRDSMDMGLFYRITQEMRDAGVQEIGVFYLGESLMEPQKTIKAVKHCKDIGFPYVFLTTNGSLCNEKVAEGLFEAGLDSLKFSINASDFDQFIRVMAVKPRLYQRALDNLRKTREVRDRGYSTKLYASSIMYDGEQQERMEALIDEHVRPYVDQHYWLPLYSMGAVAIEREEELGYKPTAGNQGRIGGLVPPLPCWSAFTEGHVRSDGTFSLCCFDADGRFTVGDLNTTPFMDVWHSEAFQKVRRGHLKRDVTGTVCSECIAYQ